MAAAMLLQLFILHTFYITYIGIAGVYRYNIGKNLYDEKRLNYQCH